ncbi:integral membrane protein [Trabzonvirus APT65]|uniref:Integral membrane protein n=1 Tax=Aeromonas phage APT65 TaxID=2982914 RepID=A0A9E8GAE9_9CAUD|nr:integral membrane protein [Aeromonas phage APT65]
MLDTQILWLGLAVVMAISIYGDFFYTKSHEITTKTAVILSSAYVAMAVAFGGFIYAVHGYSDASLYFTGYVMEKALSVDNLMVFTAIFTFFGITCKKTQHRVLLWGIAGAIIFRGLFVAAGTTLINLHWAVQVAFGLFVLYSAYAMWKSEDEEYDVESKRAFVTKWISKVYPVTEIQEGSKFFTIINGVKYATPALLCMIVIELSDVVFAFDSVPAIFSITSDPFLVMGAMMMAILGLRALYFVLNILMDKLPHLSKAVIVVLVFIGLKMIGLPFGYHLDPMISLAIVGTILGIGCIPFKKV